MEGGRWFRASYDLLSFDFSASSQTPNRLISSRRFDATGFHLTRSSSSPTSLSATWPEIEPAARQAYLLTPAPARRAVSIGAQLTARSKGATTMLAICSAKPGLIFHRA